MDLKNNVIQIICEEADIDLEKLNFDATFNETGIGPLPFIFTISRIESDLGYKVDENKLFDLEERATIRQFLNIIINTAKAV